MVDIGGGTPNLAQWDPTGPDRLGPVRTKYLNGYRLCFGHRSAGRGSGSDRKNGPYPTSSGHIRLTIQICGIIKESETFSDMTAQD